MLYWQSSLVGRFWTRCDSARLCACVCSCYLVVHSGCPTFRKLMPAGLLYAILAVLSVSSRTGRHQKIQRLPLGRFTSTPMLHWVRGCSHQQPSDGLFCSHFLGVVLSFPILRLFLAISFSGVERRGCGATSARWQLWESNANF